MSALLRVSFHFQAEKFQGFSGDGSSFGSSASRHWEDLAAFLSCWKAVCTVPGYVMY